MKRFSAIVLVTLAGFCTAGSLYAQSHEARAKVPFDFIVGGRQLPAGDYTILSQSYGTIAVENRDRPITVISLIQPENITPFASTSRLIFYKYGDRYFLREVHCSWSVMNGEIPRSKLEKQAGTEQASVTPVSILLAAE